MHKITLRFAMIMGALALVLFALGRYFDSQCGDRSCLEQTFHKKKWEQSETFSFRYNSNQNSDDESASAMAVEFVDVSADLAVDAFALSSATEYLGQALKNPEVLMY